MECALLVGPLQWPKHMKALLGKPWERPGVGPQTWQCFWAVVPQMCGTLALRKGNEVNQISQA